ncbi:MAG: hypothetical protein ACR2P1_25485 [Pseudomonadales bacterium]
MLSLAVSLLGACDNGGSSGERGSNPNSPIPEVAVDTFPYVAEATYAPALKPCVYQGANTQECTLQRLPFLGQENAAPDIDAIMQRVLVSHRWMGENFRSVLVTLPDDLLLMLRSVTAVVIASDIRPSYFRSDTGAIYLDADYVWLTAAQQAEISQEEDFRSGFGSALQVALPWRFVQNDSSVRLRPAANTDGSRSVDSLRIPLAFLLYHELAHAVDSMHPSRFDSLESSRSASYYARFANELKSTTLTELFPLQSTLMRNLAAVSFAGEEATASQRALQPPTVSEAFTPDGAITYYGYSTIREDLATVFDTLMMSYHFGIEEEVAVTNNPGPEASASDYIVYSGQRGRLSDPALIERAAWVANEIYPGVASDIEAHLRNLPAPRLLRQDSAFGSNQFRDSSFSNVDKNGTEKFTTSLVDEAINTLPVCGTNL